MTERLFDALNGLSPDEVRQRLLALQAIIERAPIPIAIAHDSACRVITANRALATLLGTSEDANISLSQPTAVKPGYRIQRDGRDLPIAELPMQYAIAHRTAVSNEIEILRADGTVRYVQNDVEPLYDTHGQIYGCVSVCVDLTERKRAELALLEADRLKDEFLATLSHELRNPLAPLRTALEVLRIARDDRDLSDKARTTMERQLAHLVRLTDDLLDVSRITQNKVELRRERVDLCAALHNAVEASWPTIDQQGHALRMDVPSHPVWVIADVTRLAQVFANLLSNAARYTPRGGRILVTAVVEDGRARVVVADTGIGIPRQLLPRIFDMFTQLPAVRDKTHGGLGIGLTLAKRLVELHDGAIEARSDGPGLGSQFIVTLPVSEEHAIAGRGVGRDAGGRVRRMPGARRRRRSRRSGNDGSDAAVQRPRRAHRVGWRAGRRDRGRIQSADRLPGHWHAADGRIRSRAPHPRRARITRDAGGADGLGAGRRQAPIARGGVRSSPDQAARARDARPPDRVVRHARTAEHAAANVGGRPMVGPVRTPPRSPHFSSSVQCRTTCIMLAPAT